jgi:hypothetical protein
LVNAHLRQSFLPHESLLSLRQVTEPAGFKDCDFDFRLPADAQDYAVAALGIFRFFLKLR